MSASTSQTRGYFELILSAHGRRDRCADPKCNAYRDRVIHFPKRYPEIEGVHEFVEQAKPKSGKRAVKK